MRCEGSWFFGEIEIDIEIEREKSEEEREKCKFDKMVILSEFFVNS